MGKLLCLVILLTVVLVQGRKEWPYIDLRISVSCSRPELGTMA